MQKDTKEWLKEIATAIGVVGATIVSMVGIFKTLDYQIEKGWPLLEPLQEVGLNESFAAGSIATVVGLPLLYFVFKGVKKGVGRIRGNHLTIGAAAQRILDLFTSHSHPGVIGHKYWKADKYSLDSHWTGAPALEVKMMNGYDRIQYDGQEVQKFFNRKEKAAIYAAAEKKRAEIVAAKEKTALDKLNNPPSSPSIGSCSDFDEVVGKLTSPTRK